MSTFSINRFHLQKEGDKRKLVAELSDLGPVTLHGGAPAPSPFHQVYPDSADEGLKVVGNTGMEVDFVVNHVERDRENDLKFYKLIPTRESIRKVPALKNFEMILFND